MGRERDSDCFTVALAGNPNVGKSTLFNTLTGMHTHTGNWAGKTVDSASREIEISKRRVRLVDTPGAYSLFAHSDEERISSEYLCFGGADSVIAVCDALSLRQSLTLALQIQETGTPITLAVNLMDEAKRQGVEVDISVLSRECGIAAVGTVAHKKKTLNSLTECALSPVANTGCAVRYGRAIEEAVQIIENAIGDKACPQRRRFFALRLLDADEKFKARVAQELASLGVADVAKSVEGAVSHLEKEGIGATECRDMISSAVVSEADRICALAVMRKKKQSLSLIDKILTGRVSAYPVMLLFLCIILYITLFFASYPTDILSQFFTVSEGWLLSLAGFICLPDWLSGLLIFGVYRTLGTVVAVMLPPMAIFFPLFALLEDSGYLPRIAYNLDRPFACTGACGKQSLTMCMGLGCNAVGIVGCRIIDSERERRLAILTNCIMPCNGRLPMMITIITVMLHYLWGKAPLALVSLIMTLLVLCAVFATFLFNFLLSKTLLRGNGTAFTIELPPYRRPRFFSVILRALYEKCTSVLLRAVAVAAPMGAVIFILANITVGDKSLIAHIAGALDPIGHIFGLDGGILLAFILGLPANEIVIPVLLIIYSVGGAIGADTGISEIGSILADNGWSAVTAACCAVFALFHWPCSTSVITVYRETKSIKDTALAVIIPTVTGLFLCFLINCLAQFFLF